MKTLVLCVDRDNDIGVKTGIRGPLVGRDDCLAAAMKLGLADPEDADLNALLTAISMYDELQKSGQPAEVAAIVGDVRVGPVSDRILTQQLDEVLDEIKPERAYLVSDGAEDESIYPMIASRIRVDHTRRVFVRQNPALESTWFMLAKAWKDPKIARKFVVPLGLSLILFSALWFVNPAAAVPAIAFLLGLYILWSAFSFRPREALAKAADYYERVRSAPITGNLSVFFRILAVIPFLVGVFFGWQQAGNQSEYVRKALAFVGGSVVWFLFGFLTLEAGRVAEAYVKKGRVPRHVLIVAASFLATGLLFLAGIKYLEVLFGSEPSGTVTFILLTISVAIFILIASALSYRPREEQLPADSWRH
jgi:putative membrane protein